MAITGSKNKSKSSSSQTQTQSGTQTSTLTPEARAMLLARQAEIGGQTYQALDPSAYKAYQDPYEQEVVDATTADINAGRSVALNDQRAQALARGAKGLSDRRGVYEAETTGQFDRTLASTLAALRSRGYSQSVGIAQGENSNKNQFNANTQSRIDQLLALLASDRTVTTNGTMSGTSRGSQTGYNFGASWTPSAGFG